jgi:hypothetical protein
MIGQYLPQTNETCYGVLQEFKTLKRQIFHQLNLVLQYRGYCQKLLEFGPCGPFSKF